MQLCDVLRDTNASRYPRKAKDPPVTAKDPSVTDFQRLDLMLGPKNPISLFASVVVPLISRLMCSSFQQCYWLIGPMGSPQPPPEKKGREAAASRGWMRFRRERRAGAAIFGQTEVVHSTKMSCCPCCIFVLSGRRIS